MKYNYGKGMKSCWLTDWLTHSLTDSLTKWVRCHPKIVLERLLRLPLSVQVSKPSGPQAHFNTQCTQLTFARVESTSISCRSQNRSIFPISRLRVVRKCPGLGALTRADLFGKGATHAVNNKEKLKQNKTKHESAAIFFPFCRLRHQFCGCHKRACQPYHCAKGHGHFSPSGK